ncbi:hypothetical protein [Azovibrio restrictus]|uniref:hypothetical protein n=1 Tax=Azovibrio restrictus TaxID=146938 RepID=UPI0026EAE794|nr:hypothetical protein [Azovibrio restrictus]
MLAESPDPVVATAARLPPWWRQLLAAQRREVRFAMAELASLKGFMPLLMKARNGGSWSAEEKRQLLEHLRRFSRLSPYFMLLLLPGSALLLPVYAWWLDRRRERRASL